MERLLLSVRAGVRVGVTLSAAVMLAVAGPAADAGAYDRAAYPAQSTGNRGTDVLALQHLLTAADQSTPVNGHFDTATAAALKRFQSAHGLASDAIAGPATWTSLTPTLREGASGPAVRALQSELNAKSGSSLTVDGVFGAATKTVVVRFQGQAGLAADGVAGPATWKNLLWHFERVDAAPNNLCDQDPDGNTAANWGTAAAVAQLEAAAKAFAATGRGRVPVGDLSWELGGDIPGHASHEQGLDADIWPIRTDGASARRAGSPGGPRSTTARPPAASSRRSAKRPPGT